MNSRKILIGGKAMMVHGSTRLTSDTDYLIFDEQSHKMFIKDEINNIDYINCNSSNFFKKIWNEAIKSKSDIASPEILLELKSYAYVEHMLQGFFLKANNDAFDMRYLVIKFNLKAPLIFKKYATKGEYEEIKKITTINK